MAKDTKERILTAALKKTDEAIRQIEAFSRHFIKTYAPDQTEAGHDGERT